MLLIIDDCRRKWHSARYANMRQRYDEHFSCTRWQEMTHNAAFIASIGDVRDCLTGLVQHGDVFLSEVFHCCWHQFDFEWNSRLECDKQRFSLLRIVKHLGPLTSGGSVI